MKPALPAMLKVALGAFRNVPIAVNERKVPALQVKVPWLLIEPFWAVFPLQMKVALAPLLITPNGLLVIVPPDQVKVPLFVSVPLKVPPFQAMVPLLVSEPPPDKVIPLVPVMVQVPWFTIVPPPRLMGVLPLTVPPT